MEELYAHPFDENHPCYEVIIWESRHSRGGLFDGIGEVLTSDHPIARVFHDITGIDNEDQADHYLQTKFNETDFFSTKDPSYAWCQVFDSAVKGDFDQVTRHTTTLMDQGLLSEERAGILLREAAANQVYASMAKARQSLTFMYDGLPATLIGVELYIGNARRTRAKLEDAGMDIPPAIDQAMESADDLLHAAYRREQKNMECEFERNILGFEANMLNTHRSLMNRYRRQAEEVASRLEAEGRTPQPIEVLTKRVMLGSDPLG